MKEAKEKYVNGKWKGSNDTTPNDSYARFLDLVYKFLGGVIDSTKYEDDVELYLALGEDLYSSATNFWLHDFPAFALEVLPNRNSLIYAYLYGIENEALTVFRGTLRYEGFGEIMGSLARLGFFNNEVCLILTNKERPTYRTFLYELLGEFESSGINRDDVFVKANKLMTDRLITLEICKEDGVAATRTAKTIMLLGFYEQTEVPSSCKSAFDVTCLCMEERLAYTSMEQIKDMAERLPYGSYDFKSIRYASELDQNGHDADVNGDCHRSLWLLLQRLQLQLLLITLRLNGLKI
ncbi:alpha-aminoadipic semialdehyde synthase [Tanacetum coccineum]